MIKILLIGEIYSQNLGDPLLCQTVERIISENLDTVEITPLDISGKISKDESYVIKRRGRLQKFLMRSSKYFEKLYMLFPEYRVLKLCWHRAMLVWSHLDELLSKKEFDLVVFAGGEMFMDYFAGVIFLIVKKLKRQKVLFHACGMHHLSKDSVFVLRKALTSNNVKSISLRDSYERFITLFPVKEKTIETYDTALICSRHFGGELEGEIDYGIGVIDKPETIPVQREIIRYFLESKLKWKIVTNGALSDLETAKQILRDLGINEIEYNNYVFERPQTTKELINQITKTKHLISFRMHSQVVAASFGIPSYGFVWDKKLIEFYNKMNLNNNYADINEPIDIDNIVQILNYDYTDLPDKAFDRGEKSKECLLESIRQVLGNV